MRRKKWLVKLEPAARWVRAQLEAAQHRAMLPMDIRTGEVIDSMAREVPGEPTEASEALTQEPEQPQPERPYLPEVVQKGILSRASKGDQTTASEGRRGIVIGYLEAIWTTEMPNVREAKRHAILNFLFGDPSSKQLTKARCDTILAWLTDTQEDGKRVLNAFAISEAIAMVPSSDDLPF